MFIPFWLIGICIVIFLYIVMRMSSKIDDLNQIINHKKGQLLFLQNKLNQKKEEFDKHLAREKSLWKKEKEIIIQFENSSISQFPVIATVLSDYRTARDEAIEYHLRTKKIRAPKAAEQVKEIRHEKRELMKELYGYKWELKYLKNLIPWIDDIEDDVIITSDQTYNQVDRAVNDEAIRWLSPEEYNKLPDVEKYQRALDRYMKRPKKSSWEAGQEYERYIGYLYENDGFHVTYFGASEGLHDFGRDLICKKNDSIHIVQCKRWSSKKQIHEKHINQLFGTTVMYYLSEMSVTHTVDGFYQALNDKKIIPVFASTTGYSETALQFAKSLGVICKIKPMGPYPVIKCNINQSTHEHIYHLPFDQQYDHCVISKEQGEFYALTVQEAEDAGFRRAKRWKGNIQKYNAKN